MSEITIRERSLLCSTEEVRAILDGRKTQFRRPLREQPKLVNPLCEDVWEFNGEVVGSASDLACHLFHDHYGNHGTPYGSAYANGSADRLWVREAWQALRFCYDFDSGYADGWSEAPLADVKQYSEENPSLPRRARYAVVYNAGSGWGSYRDDRGFRWRPSVHMPRWASRILLEITDVRVERVQDISVEDCITEGLSTQLREHDAVMDLRDQFQHRWDSINAKRGFGWDLNCWVWVIGFKVLEVK